MAMKPPTSTAPAVHSGSSAAPGSARQGTPLAHVADSAPSIDTQHAWRQAICSAGPLEQTGPRQGRGALSLTQARTRVRAVQRLEALRQHDRERGADEQARAERRHRAQLGLRHGEHAGQQPGAQRACAPQTPGVEARPGPGMQSTGGGGRRVTGDRGLGSPLALGGQQHAGQQPLAQRACPLARVLARACLGPGMQGCGAFAAATVAPGLAQPDRCKRAGPYRATYAYAAAATGTAARARLQT